MYCLGLDQIDGDFGGIRGQNKFSSLSAVAEMISYVFRVTNIFLLRWKLAVAQHPS